MRVREIRLRRGQVALVDEEDYERLSLFSWGITPNGYARCCQPVGSPEPRVFMHHMVVGKPPRGLVVDHLDMNKLNNTRANLRHVSYSANNRNSVRSNPLGLRGVRQCGTRGRYQAYILVNKKQLNLGCYGSPDEAHEVWRAYCLKHFGKVPPQSRKRES